jgi:hypothetical protein
LSQLLSVRSSVTAVVKISCLPYVKAVLHVNRSPDLDDVHCRKWCLHSSANHTLQPKLVRSSIKTEDPISRLFVGIRAQPTLHQIEKPSTRASTSKSKRVPGVKRIGARAAIKFLSGRAGSPGSRLFLRFRFGRCDDFLSPTSSPRAVIVSVCKPVSHGSNGSIMLLYEVFASVAPLSDLPSAHSN